uniref:Uncharacterized protein n=1 Tax=Anguilla anguilla TaxID=7936 RepID=A0A0E9X9R6_ANGAN
MENIYKDHIKASSPHILVNRIKNLNHVML